MQGKPKSSILTFLIHLLELFSYFLLVSTHGYPAAYTL